MRDVKLNSIESDSAFLNSFVAWSPCQLMMSGLMMDETMSIDAFVTLALIALPIYIFFRWVQQDSEKQDAPGKKSSPGR